MAKRDRKKEIMEVAERLFASKRFHEIKMDDVAAAARVGKGTIYRYFKDKDDLFVQTLLSGFDELCELVGSKIPEEEAFLKRLSLLCKFIGKHFRRKHNFFKMSHSGDVQILWARKDVRKELFERRKKMIEMVAGVIRKGIEEGDVRRDIKAEVLAAFLLGMLWTRDHDLGNAPKAMKKDKVIVELFYRGVKRNEGEKV
ncbi:MAG: TetR/AcrR family transcriptional regulator [Planctomycetota bacterium]|nr:TetR/AcrR family transcriptional regulator [Planctomycetota bacterium]